MALAAFNTLELADELEQAGISEKEARAISLAILKSHESLELATKSDLKHLEERVDAKLEKFDTGLRHEISDLRKDMEARFTSMDARFTSMEARLTSMDVKLTSMDAKHDAQHESLRKDMTSLEERINSKLDKLLLQLTFRLGGVIVAAVTVLSLLPQFFH